MIGGSAAQSSAVQCFDVGLGISHGDGQFSDMVKFNYESRILVSVSFQRASEK